MKSLKLLAALALAAGMTAAPAFADGSGKGPVVKTPPPLSHGGQVYNAEPIKSHETCDCSCTSHGGHDQHIDGGCTHGWTCSFAAPSGRIWHQPVPGGPYEILQDVPMEGMSPQHSSHHESHTAHMAHSSHAMSSMSMTAQAQTVSLDNGFFATSSGGVGTGVGQGFVGGGGVIVTTNVTSSASAGAFTRVAFRGGNRGRRSGRRGGKH